MTIFDMLCPSGNEAELAQAAKALGWQEIVFLYVDAAKKPLIPSVAGISIKSCGLVQSVNDVQRAKKNHEFAAGVMERQFSENQIVDFMIDFEEDSGKDFFYQRRAGLDDFMCKSAKAKDITLLLSIKHAEKPLVIGRLRQNLILAKKNQTKVHLVTLASSVYDLRAPKDLAGFESILLR